MIKIDPWSASEIKNYEKVFHEFGVEKISDSQKKFFNHYLFQRNIIIGHRDIDKLIDAVKNRKPFYCMSGIACSGKLHLGHKIIFDIHLLLKRKGAKLFTGVADLDGYLSRPQVKTLSEAGKFAVENLSHALALGIAKSDVYVQSKMDSCYFSFGYEISKKITPAEFKAIYGKIEFGKISAVILQIADILYPQIKSIQIRRQCKPKLRFGSGLASASGFSAMTGTVPVGLDQDPHIRLTRDLCYRLPYKLIPPGGLYIAHQPGLKKATKMSSSEPQTAIFLGDEPDVAKKKIHAAFSGGRDSLELHKKLGGVPEKDMAFQLLRYHHPNSKFVEKIYHDYKSGSLISGELKNICSDFIVKFLKNHQKKLKRTQKIAEKMIFG